MLKSGAPPEDLYHLFLIEFYALQQNQSLRVINLCFSVFSLILKNTGFFNLPFLKDSGSTGRGKEGSSSSASSGMCAKDVTVRNITENQQH